MKLARGMQRGKFGPRFDRQLVQRHMSGSEPDRPIQIGRPDALALTRKRVNKIEIDPTEMALCNLKRGQPLSA